MGLRLQRALRPLREALGRSNALKRLEVGTSTAGEGM